jgi:hypothetical protein
LPIPDEASSSFWFALIPLIIWAVASVVISGITAIIAPTRSSAWALLNLLAAALSMILIGSLIPQFAWSGFLLDYAPSARSGSALFTASLLAVPLLVGAFISEILRITMANLRERQRTT